MRLINTRTLLLEEFYGDGIPEYAILSHTWEGEEVTFQDWQNLHAASKKAGFAKIEGACREARRDGLGYLWVDTNCIDKSSSAELNEAINSMFAWYQNSALCYAYLSDVLTKGQTNTDLLKQISKSRWFTRGWTLQELLAPRRLIFYSQNWDTIGERSSEIGQEIAKITGIDILHLTGELPLEAASVAKKMCWLSRRTTTRIEDIAYCMLGIFNINMPLLYGEGLKAFVRLQEEIIKVSNDHTIFCWTWTDSVPQDWVSMLAPSPGTFQFSGSIEPTAGLAGRVHTYSMTNAGLSIHLPLIQAWSFYFVVLNARAEGHGRYERACIPVRGFLDKPASNENGLFQRVKFPAGIVFLSLNWAVAEKALFVRSRHIPLGSIPAARENSSRYSILLTIGNTKALLDKRLSSLSQFDSGSGKFLLEKTKDLIGLETYPPGLFDLTRSLFLFDHRIDGPVRGGLLRLGTFETSGCVIFFAIKISPVTGVLWFCQIFPASTWGSHRSQRRVLLENLIRQATLRVEDQRADRDQSASLVIGDEIERSRHVIRVAFFSPGGDPGAISNFTIENADNGEVDSDTDSIVPALAHRPNVLTVGQKFEI